MMRFMWDNQELVMRQICSIYKSSIQVIEAETIEIQIKKGFYKVPNSHT